MKILYITQTFKQLGFGTREYDFPTISNTIMKGIQSHFVDWEIRLAKDVVAEEKLNIDEELKQFDIFICDMSAANASVYFLVGKIDNLGKPTIFIKSSEYDLPFVVSHYNYLTYSEASIDNDFIEELNSLIENAKNNPANFKSSIKNTQNKAKAFISYSHKDKAYLDRLLVHLKPLERKGMIDIWQDTRIKIGDKWEDKITKALLESNVAILLISADFMASEFIIENELPPILSKVEVKGTKILPLIVSHCRFSRESTLNRFQAANPPDEPLSIMDENQREAIYDKVAKEIETALGNA